ncbi:MAG: class I SAM-dependent methyltransferase [Candidatus Abawacabacteria bacterium]|nr:class I SAM-dependent methyltransferase [Candidatus Abawacabacteria bacterium]
MSQDWTNWDKAAWHYHQFVDSRADKLRTELLYPALLGLEKKWQKKLVLDIGCGNGFFAKELANNGASVWAFDGPQMITLAKQSFSDKHITYAVHDATEQFPYESDFFDIITCNLVAMDMLDITGMLAESRRVLKPEGRLLITVLHPCFTPPVGKFRRGLLGRINQKWAYFQLKSYFQARKVSKKQLWPEGPETNYYHRSIGTYSAAFAANDFTIKQMYEPIANETFLAQYPEYFHAKSIAIFLIFELIATAPLSHKAGL